MTNFSKNCFELYCRDIKNEKYKHLTAEQEQELSRKIKMGDKNAENRLVNANVKYVISVARKYQNYGRVFGFDISDLIALGNRGLIKAAKKFDGDKGYKFITYAKWWVENGIKTKIDEDYAVSKRTRLHYEEDKEEEEGRWLLNCIDNRIDFDVFRETGKWGTTKLISAKMSEILKSHLSASEYSVITKCFGVCGELDYSTKEIARDMNISEDWVRRSKSNAMRKMKHLTELRDLDGNFAA